MQACAMLCTFDDARVDLCYLHQRGNYSATIEIRTFANPAHLPRDAHLQAIDPLVKSPNPNDPSPDKIRTYLIVNVGL